MSVTWPFWSIISRVWVRVSGEAGELLVNFSDINRSLIREVNWRQIPHNRLTLIETGSSHAGTSVSRRAISHGSENAGSAQCLLGHIRQLFVCSAIFASSFCVFRFVRFAHGA